ncbi:uncharacterized protein LOC119608506 [Lucilia sericata]|uniref:uncharacterized protein LOC119608506 n=1 Tax=Lucilia sericata TaxID=13632 RepID=UPI0018A82EE7|nr:uncharacterized protein LOC119608506 [Lucilia sericata]
MHETVKSRSTTPHCEYGKTAVTETLQLLQKWNLLELQNKFKEHEVTLRSLIYLTDEEISELIPKIGIRTIFRAMLKEWRQTYDAIAYPRASTASIGDVDSDSYLDQIELKTECNSEDFDMQNFSTEENDFQLETMKESQENEQKLDNNNNETLVPPDPVTARKLRNQFSYKGEPFNVFDILNSCSDGQTVMEFYKIHNFLDIKNRKRVVNLLIRNVVERKVEKYTAIFHDMTRQLLELFPSEKYETYFVPHNGPNSARGALYYRYSNYTRQLRKEGLLAYKKHKPKVYTK